MNQSGDAAAISTPTSRNARIVEGALLGDVAIVLLLARVYLPIPGIRMIWRLLAGSPFVLLAERRGLRVAIMSGIITYLLMTALVGPMLALTVLDTALAALLISLAGQWHIPRLVTTFVGGLLYAIVDVIIPTVAFSVLLRIPLTTIVHDLRRGIRSLVHLIARLFGEVNVLASLTFGRRAPHIPTASFVHGGYRMAGYVTDHWIPFALAAAVIIGVANVAGYLIVADMVLDRLPFETRARQVAS